MNQALCRFQCLSRGHPTKTGMPVLIVTIGPFLVTFARRKLRGKTGHNPLYVSFAARSQQLTRFPDLSHGHCVTLQGPIHLFGPGGRRIDGNIAVHPHNVLKTRWQLSPGNVDELFLAPQDPRGSRYGALYNVDARKIGSINVRCIIVKDNLNGNNVKLQRRLTHQVFVSGIDEPLQTFPDESSASMISLRIVMGDNNGQETSGITDRECRGGFRWWYLAVWIHCSGKFDPGLGVLHQSLHGPSKARGRFGLCHGDKVDRVNTRRQRAFVLAVVATLTTASNLLDGSNEDAVGTFLVPFASGDELRVGCFEYRRGCVIVTNPTILGISDRDFCGMQIHLRGRLLPTPHDGFVESLNGALVARGVLGLLHGA
eukprot:scaffold1690_cov182-Amphora_coffeaeformis.AAC.65